MTMIPKNLDVQAILDSVQCISLTKPKVGLMMLSKGLSVLCAENKKVQRVKMAIFLTPSRPDYTRYEA